MCYSNSNIPYKFTKHTSNILIEKFLIFLINLQNTLRINYLEKVKFPKVNSTAYYSIQNLHLMKANNPVNKRKYFIKIMYYIKL